MKRKSKGIRRRILSILLAAAMVVTSLQITVNPEKVKEVQAAPKEKSMETGVNLSTEHVKDPNVLSFYKILANAQKKNKVSDLAGKNAGEIINEYGNNSEYTTEVYGTYLVNYSGAIDFTGLKITNTEGIGWARSATEIKLPDSCFSSPMTAVLNDEFASCTKMTKIILPSTVTKIGNNAFDTCTSLKTLQIGDSGTENTIDLTKVKEVGNSAFNGCSAIVSVEFAPYQSGSTELKLGSYAFASCGALTEIEVPIKSVSNLGTNVFDGCKKLSRAGLHDDLTYLGNALFKGTGTDNAKGIFLYVIEKKQENPEVSQLPSKITYIGNNCFEGAKLCSMDLTTCTSLTKINQDAFAGTAWDIGESLKLPSSLKTLELRSFNAANLLELTLPDSCTDIQEKAFINSGIRQISLSQSLKEIKAETFSGCEELYGGTITIRGGSEALLEEIGDKAFYDCGSLGTTEFLKDLKKLTRIGESAFASCYDVLESSDGKALQNEYREQRVIDGLQTVVLPDCVTTLGDSVFANDYFLRTADLGTGISHIPDKAFFNSQDSDSSGAGLEEVIVSGKLETIGEKAFANQARLYTIGYKDGSGTTVKNGTAQFKEGLLSIGKEAFSGCGVSASFNAGGAIAYVPKESITKIGDIADIPSGKSVFMFYDYRDTSQTWKNNYCYMGALDESEIVSKNELINKGYYDDKYLKSLTSAGKDKYDEVYIVAKMVYLDQDLIKHPSITTGYTPVKWYGDMYDTQTPDYENRLYSTETGYCLTEELDQLASKTAESGKDPFWVPIQSAVINNLNVPKIEAKPLTMQYAWGLRDVIIPDTVLDDNLGENAFTNCINLNKVTLSENLTEIKDNTFSGAGYTIVNSVDPSSKTKKFYDYGGLRSIRIPDSVKKIGVGAFRNCYNLLLEEAEGSSFGIGVKEIGDNAFSSCFSLDGIRFPTSLESIGKYAFANCSLQIEEKRERDYDEGKKYIYYENAPEYGTRTVKLGLNKIDFISATHLKEVGVGAFMKTNVTSINMTESPLTVIPDQLFDQCTYLENISFQNKTTSLGSKVLKDTTHLKTVTIPAQATIKKDTIYGAFGEFVSPNNVSPTINFTAGTDPVVVPIGSSLRLPINAINSKTVSGVVKISMAQKQADGKYGDYQDILVDPDHAVNGLYAEYNDQEDPCSFILYGSEYITEPVRVRVEVSVGFRYADSTSLGMNSPQTLDFDVMVKDVPTTDITLSAAEDPIVKQNPTMYVDKNGQKSLYISLNSQASKNGVTLTANVEPLETTDQVTWESDNPQVVVLSDEKYENGKATVLVKTTEFGSAKVTVRSGTKSDVIYVYSQIPIVSNGLVCTTDGTCLPEKLPVNSSGSPYELQVGDAGQISVTPNYGKDYSDEQKNTYGESWVFSTSDENVITVEQDGSYRAKGEGNAVITITAQASGARYSFYFSVSDGLTRTPKQLSIQSDSAANTVNVGGALKLSAKITPSLASQEVKWSLKSGTSDILSLSANADGTATVTGLKKGKATVVAESAEKAGVKGEIEIQVLSPAKEIKILDGNITLEVNKSYTISKTTNVNSTKGYYVNPVDSTDKISWSSSNEGIVSVASSNANSVTIKAVASGEADLTCTAAPGVSASIHITVPGIKVPMTGVSVDKEVTLNVGASHKLNPQAIPANTTDQVTYTYTSANANIARVDASGMIQAVAPGNTTVTAKASNGKAASCTVFVKSPAKKIALLVNKPSAKKIYMAKGQTISVKTKITPTNTTDRLTWKSNKSKVAAVSTNGVITAKKKGTAKITVTATSGKKATITVVVSKKQIKAKKVKAKAKKTVKRKKTIRVTATLNPKKSTDALTFSSNKPAIATVDAFGYVTGKKKGKVKITVTASSGKKATKTIKVK